MTIGAEIRKEKVTPSGTPAERKPMNSGTAEQEQKGDDAETGRQHVADADPLAGKQRRVRSGEKKVWITPIRKTMPISSNNTLGVS